MHIARLELCKELYELSGWKNDGKYWGALSDNGEQIPSYTLDNLLRKLPSRILSQSYNRLTIYPEYHTLWYMGYPKNDTRNPANNPDLYVLEELPEDAACRLAIELFKQGILTPELSNKEKK